MNGECVGLISAPIGSLHIHWNSDALTGIVLMPPERTVSAQNLVTTTTLNRSEHHMRTAIINQLRDYFERRCLTFDLPLSLRGTPFQQAVWALLQTLPVGETRTYGELARQLGSAARAVGQACRANPCPIVVPCHRVVAAQGLGGFGGDASGERYAIKSWLLRHEGATGQFLSDA